MDLLLRVWQKAYFCIDKSKIIMPAKKTILVERATYLDGFRLLIAFTDGKEQEVDFADFINNNHKESLSRYKKPVNFKKFRIEQGNVVWGKDWDLIFPVQELYNGKVN